ncbi:MAG: glycosyltransferase family 39 protein [Bacteroidales bacterium]|nr:glycosyltransferase family 39 protein [Bacteroidales bacterium]
MSFLLHFKIFNKDLVGFHVWRQTQTQNTTISFAKEDINIFNPRRNERGAGDGIFRMEFPLSQWIVSFGLRMFSNDVMVSRIMNFIFGLLSFLGMFKLFRALKANEPEATAGAAFFLFSPVFYYYTINPMPDNLALTLSVWGILSFVRWFKQTSEKDFIIGALLISLAALVKLPFILYFPGLALLVVLKAKVNHFRRFWIRELIILLIALLPVLAWYSWVIPGWEGNGIVAGITGMNTQQRSMFLYYCLYHLRASLPELLLAYPAVPVFLLGVWIALKRWRAFSSLKWAFLVSLLALGGLMIFEMNMIEKVHDYYFIPFLPLLGIILLIGIRWLIRPGIGLKIRKYLLLLLIVSMPVYTYFRIQDRWNRTGFNPDLLKYKTELRELIPNDALVLAGNDSSHHIFMYYIGKKGWVFENNWTNDQKIKTMIENGCRYLYCDSRHVDQNPRIQRLFGTKLAEFGSISVFELKLPEEIN